MRWLAATLVWWLSAAGLARGQVEVEVLLDQSQFLADESLILGVRVVNRSGQTLVMGEREDWLAFIVESRDGLPVPRRAELPVVGRFSLESSASATKHLDLMPYYKLGEPGRYRVSALVRVPDWEKTFASPPVEFDVGRGTAFWEQAFGVPQAEGEPEVRKYVLQQANYEKRPMLYLRVTDERELQVFRVLPLGPLLSFSRPEHLIDQKSNLHVLFQTGARTFRYAVLDPGGRWVKRQTHQYSRSRPVLRSNQGEVAVVGGLRRPGADDLPPAEVEAKGDDGHGGSP